MYCADGQVVTCAHVIAKPAPPTPPGEPLYVMFTFASNAMPVTATIDQWHPEPANDVAVLSLHGPIPPGAEAAPLWSQLGGVSGHGYLAYGYPRGHEDAVPSRGQVIAAGQGRLSLLVQPGTGFPLEAGFSGSPVWDEDLRGVLGIVVERELPRHEHNRLGHVDTGLGYAIPVDEIAKLWEPLAAHIRSPTRADLLERLDALTVLPLRDGELPTVQQVDVYDIGVKRSKYVTSDNPTPPYVHRRGVDQQLEDALAGSSFVLVIGSPAAGKSRSTIELLRRVMPAARLIVPTDDPGALSQLARLPLPIGESGAVVWLEGIDRYLVPKGIDLKVLEDLQRHDPPIKIVATMTTKPSDADPQKLEGTAGHTVRSVLGKAREVWIGHELAEEDLAEARSAYPGEDFQARGIGAQLVATRELEQKYRDAKDKSPAGWAVLQATVDWRRMGLELPVPESCLRRLFDRYLDDTILPNADHDQLFGPGLKWATALVEGNVAAVFRVATGAEPAYRAFDYVVELADGERDIVAVRPVPGPVWSEAIESVGIQELLSISFAALTRRRLDVAREALKRGRLQQDDGHVAAWSVLLLGELENEFGDPEQGRQLLRDAAASGFPDVVSIAHVDLGAALIYDDDLASAEELLTAALTADDPSVSLLAKVNLGALRTRQGDIEAAQAFLEEVLAADESESAPLANVHLGELLMGQAGRGHKPLGPTRPADARRVGGTALVQAGESCGNLAVQMARANLGGLLLSRGEPDRARYLLQTALNSGDTRVTHSAQAALGWLELAQGNHAEGRQLLESAAASEHTQARVHAQLGLAVLAREDGATEDSQRQLREIADSGEAMFSAMAADMLGDLLAGEGDLAGAEVAYQRAIDVEYTTWSDVAKIDLATLLSGFPDGSSLARARQLLSEVADGGHPEQHIVAAGLLGQLLASTGDLEGAKAAYQRVTDTHHPDHSPTAKIELAKLLGRAGDHADLVRAGSLLRDVAASGHPDLAPAAADALGDFLVSRDDVAGAKQAYQQAIDSGHPRWRPLALIDLGVLLAEADDDFEVAATHLSEATGAADRDVAASAHLSLGYVRRVQGHRVDAREQFTEAIGCGAAEVEVRAEFALAKLAAEDGDLAEAVEHLDLMQEWLVDPAPAADPDGEVNGSAGLAFLRHCDFLVDAYEIDAAEELLDVLLERAEAGGDQELVMATQARLGRVVFLRGDLVRARDLLSRAFRSVQARVSGGTTVEPMVRRFLASVLARQEEFVQARELLIPLADSDDREHRPAGLLLLGELAVIMVKFDEAKKWYAQAIEQAASSQDGDTEERAREELAALLERIRTRRPTPRALDSSAPVGDRSATAPVQDPGRAPDGMALTPEVLALLGEVASAEGCHREAQHWLSLAEAAAIDPELRMRVRYSMAVSYLESGDHAQARRLVLALEGGDGTWIMKARQILDALDEATLTAGSFVRGLRPAGMAE
ncbi:MAG: tetratricopeptide repeat protein [Pseudonocardiaceae bacterium]